MAGREFNELAYRAEHPNRLAGLASYGEMDGIRPNDSIRQTMREAIQLGNPFIKDGDPFIVMGNDGFDGSWFPTGSFQTVEEAKEHEKKKKGEEHLYSGGDDVSTTFHTFTIDGFQVRHAPGSEPAGS